MFFFGPKSPYQIALHETLGDKQEEIGNLKKTLTFMSPEEELHNTFYIQFLAENSFVHKFVVHKVKEGGKVKFYLAQSFRDIKRDISKSFSIREVDFELLLDFLNSPSHELASLLFQVPYEAIAVSTGFKDFVLGIIAQREASINPAFLP